MNELLQFDESLVIGHLSRRMLAECRSWSVNGSCHAPIERQPCAADEVDCNTSAVRRVLNGKTKFEIHGHPAEQLPLHPEEADLVVVLPRYVVAGTDMDVFGIEAVLGH